MCYVFNTHEAAVECLQFTYVSESLDRDKPCTSSSRKQYRKTVQAGSYALPGSTARMSPGLCVRAYDVLRIGLPRFPVGTPHPVRFHPQVLQREHDAVGECLLGIPIELLRTPHLLGLECVRLTGSAAAW